MGFGERWGTCHNNHLAVFTEEPFTDSHGISHELSFQEMETVREESEAM